MFLILTLIAQGVGIGAIILANNAINNDTEDNGEIQAAKIIVDSLKSLDTALPTEISVIDANQECPSGWEPMFEIEWPGTQRGCHYEGQTMEYSQYEARRRRQKKGVGCNDPINALDAVTQTVFSGKQICMNADGAKILDTQRADSANKECPSGYTACSSSAENWYDVYCVRDSAYPAECPIIEMNFA